MKAPRVVLASASPRRSHVLGLLGIAHERCEARVEESLLTGETPEAHVLRLARAKAAAVAARQPDALVIGGDTVVALGSRILGKPAGRDDAVAMLLRLAGRTHSVFSGVAVAGPEGVLASVGRADVVFRSFDAAEARAYVATGEPEDKAGAYGIQGRGAALVERISGDYYAVVGLPVVPLLDLMARQGWRYRFGDLDPVEEGR